MYARSWVKRPLRDHVANTRHCRDDDSVHRGSVEINASDVKQRSTANEIARKTVRHQSS